MTSSLDDDNEDDEGAVFEALGQRIESTPPGCLAEFDVEACDPETDGEFAASAWRLKCRCGGDTGEVLGYPLSQFNTDYSGDEFVRPLFFKCGSCKQTTQIIDQHGYHDEFAKLEGSKVGSATYRGTGPTTAFHCGCGNATFEVTADFYTYPGAIDVLLDEPELSPENYFNGFHARGRCTQCGKMSSIASFEC